MWKLSVIKAAHPSWSNQKAALKAIIALKLEDPNVMFISKSQKWRKRFVHSTWVAVAVLFIGTFLGMK